MFCFQINLQAQSDPKIYDDVFFKSALKSIKNMQFNKAIDNLELFSSNSFAKKDIRTLKILADCYWKVRRYKDAKNCYDTLLLLNSFYTLEEKFHISELFAMSGNYFKAAEYLNGIPGFENKMNGYNSVANYLKDSLDFQLSLHSNTVDSLLMPMIKKDSLFWVSKTDILSSPKNSFIAKYFSNQENNQFNELVDSSEVVANKISIFSRPNTYSYSSISGSIFFTMFQDYLSKKKIDGPNYFRIAESKINGSKIKDINLFTLGIGSYSMLQ
jgi:tetratricopeptide (TPR) repeat protein